MKCDAFARLRRRLAVVASASLQAAAGIEDSPVFSAKSRMN